MKSGQLIRYNMKNIFLQNLVKNEAKKLVPDLFLIFKKALDKVKASDQHLSFNILWYTLTLTYNENKIYSTSDCCSRCVLNFYFLKNGLELAMIFKEKYFSYYILLIEQV